jgi:predicted ATPase/DNA-binding SARP family transcriptional activator
MESLCRIFVLGAVRLEQGDRVVTRFRTQKTAALLAHLALHLGRPSLREDLVGLLWPDAEPAQARNSLSQAISSLRHQLEPPNMSPGRLLVADRHSIALAREHVWVDVAEIVRLERSGQFEAALELIGGPFAAGIGEAWIEAERDSLRNRFEGFALRSARRHLEAGEHDSAATIALRWLTVEPCCEAAAEIAVRALIAVGREEQAGIVVAELTRQMRAIGLRPSLRLDQRAVRAEDLSTPVREEAVIEPAMTPEAASLGARLGWPRNAFFGRDAEIVRIAGLLHPASDNRLVTCTGPAGAGKSRLALEAARRLEAQYGARLWVVSVAEAQRSEVMLAALTAALGMSGLQSPTAEVLAEAIGSRPALVVLDNLEQLLDDPRTSDIVTALILGSGIRVLATSRRRLGSEDEVEVRVPPLEVPAISSDEESLAQNPSVALFVDRAQAVRPDFRLGSANARAVCELCRALEGIPLALELAAARAQVLGPAQMLEKLPARLDVFAGRDRDANSRHRTLRNAVEWSYRLLHPGLQRFFAGLSVFHDGWTLEAAEEVLNEPLALDYLAELVEFSMIGSEEDTQGRIRFSMLETLRAYASEACDREDELAEAHLEHYLALSEAAAPNLTKPELEEWQGRLDAERGNLRAALDRTIRLGRTEVGLRFVGALWRYWHQRGLVAEGRDWSERVLALDVGKAAPDIMAAALHGAGRLAYLQGDYEIARSRSEQAHRLFRRLPDMSGVGLCLTALGSVAFEEGEYAVARAYFRGALAIWRVLGDAFGIGAALNWLGIVYTDLREYERAQEALQESFAVRASIGDWLGASRALNSLGIVSRQLGDLEEAARAYERSLELARRAGDRRAEAGCLSNLGLVAAGRGDTVLAEGLFRESLEIHREVGDKWGLATALANLGNLAADTGLLDDARGLLEQSLEIRQRIGNRSGVALALEGLGVVASRAGEHERAVLLFARASRLREEIGSPPAPADADRLVSAMAASREALGKEWQEIRKMGKENGPGPI